MDQSIPSLYNEYHLETISLTLQINKRITLIIHSQKKKSNFCEHTSPLSQKLKRKKEKIILVDEDNLLN